MNIQSDDKALIVTDGLQTIGAVRQALTLHEAAKMAGRSESTIRSWCALYLIGRRIVGGPWQFQGHCKSEGCLSWMQ